MSLLHNVRHACSLPPLGARSLKAYENLSAGYLSGDIKITGTAGSGFAAQYDVDARGAVKDVRILSLGTGYISVGGANVLGYYAGTNNLMEQSISKLTVVSGGLNYIPGDVVLVPTLGTACVASTSVNASGSVTAVTISSHGTQFNADIPSNQIQVYFHGTSIVQTNAITSISIAFGGVMSQCQAGMIISSQPAGSPAFQAVVRNVSTSGAVTVVQIVSNGGDFLTDPTLQMSSAACTCNGLAGNVAGNLQGCLRPLVARGAVISATRAYGTTFQAVLPQLLVSNLVYTSTQDSSLPILVSSSAGPEGVFGSSASWNQSTGTISLSVRPNASLPAWKAYTVQFNLTNPLPSQFSPSVSIGSVGTVATTIAMSKAPLNAAPLLIAGFQILTSTVTGSNTGQGASTTITVRLLPIATLYPATLLTISGSLPNPLHTKRA